MFAHQISVVADTYTKQLYSVNLRNYPEFFDCFKAELENDVGNLNRVTSVRSDYVKDLLKEKFNLNVEYIQPQFYGKYG